MNQEGFVLFFILFLGGVLFLRNSSRPPLSKIEPNLNSSKKLTKKPLTVEEQDYSQSGGDISSENEINLLEPQHSTDVQEIQTISNEQPLSDSAVFTEAEEILPQELLKDEDSTRFLGNYKFQIRSFRIPKDGFSEEECEDNSAISSDDSATLRVAVSDGATEGIFSNIWSELLVNGYIENGSQIFEPSQLKLVHNEFVQKASLSIGNMRETTHWFMYEKLDRGTHATIAAVEFFDSETIHVSTVGDSCVFWHDGNEICMLPELSSKDFGSFPNTVCHLPKTWQSLKQKIVKKEISFHNHFQIALCSDALACWLVQKLREHNEPQIWENIFQLLDLNSFKEVIQELRVRKEIRNDDVTLVLIDALPLNV